MTQIVDSVATKIDNDIAPAANIAMQELAAPAIGIGDRYAYSSAASISFRGRAIRVCDVAASRRAHSSLDLFRSVLYINNRRFRRLLVAIGLVLHWSRTRMR